MSIANCEKEITLDLPDPVSQIVVEGSIYEGQTPLVILNTNFPYFGTFTLQNYQQNFVRGAKVMVSDGTKNVELQEFCWSDLTETEQQLLVAFGGEDNGIIKTITLALFLFIQKKLYINLLSIGLH